MNERTRKRIPPAFVLTLMAMFCLPLIAFNYFGFDFSGLAKEITHDSRAQLILEAHIRDCVRTAILQWAALSLSTLTVLLALIQYRFTRDRMALFIGVIQIAIYCVLRPTSLSHHDVYTFVYVLTLVAYCVPFLCLMLHATLAYNAMLDTHHTLQITQQELQYIAGHDNLTGLYNRRKFEDLLDETITNSARYRDIFALFIIDIDNLKAINDDLGHQQGDRLIKQFAEQLTALTRQGDIFSRIGGDEFALITPKLHSPSSAKKLVDRIMTRLSLPSSLDDNQRTTVSIGIAIYPIDAENTEDLLKHADTAMYKAKKAGKNTYRFYKEKLHQLDYAERVDQEQN